MNYMHNFAYVAIKKVLSGNMTRAKCEIRERQSRRILHFRGAGKIHKDNVPIAPRLHTCTSL